MVCGRFAVIWLLAAAAPVGCGAVVITFEGRVTAVPSDAELERFYLPDPGEDPSAYLLDRPAIGTPAVVQVVVDDSILWSKIDFGSFIAPDKFKITAEIPGYLTSSISRESPWVYDPHIELDHFFWASEDGTRYLGPQGSVSDLFYEWITDYGDGAIDAARFNYRTPLARPPDKFWDLVVALRQTGGGVYSADLGGAGLGPLYFDISFDRPTPVPLPASVWLLIGGVAAMISLRGRAGTD